MRRGTLCTTLDAFLLARLGRYSSLVVLVNSTKSVHYIYNLLSDEKTSHCNSMAHYVKMRRLKIISAAGCRACPRTETFNGLQKVLQIDYTPGPKTMWTYHFSDQKILMKELKRKMKKIFEEKYKNVFLAETRRRHTWWRKLRLYKN